MFQPFSYRLEYSGYPHNYFQVKVLIRQASIFAVIYWGSQLSIFSVGDFK